MRKALTACVQAISTRYLITALVVALCSFAAPLAAEEDSVIPSEAEAEVEESGNGRTAYNGRSASLTRPFDFAHFVRFAQGDNITGWRHALSMHDAPALPPDFTHFAYTNPDAPKGGTLRLAQTGSFDSLNPFIIKGRPAPGLREYQFESLMARHYDEPFSLYGLLAESVEVDENRQWVIFTLREEARFASGEPVRVEDVLFSARLLREQGRPNHRFYYGKIARMEKIGARQVRFEFDAADDREMPLIMGLMPILSEKSFASRNFAETTLEPLVGSGPYRIVEAEAGKHLIYEKDPNWWGKDLPVNRGRYNPARIVYTYYRNESSAFQAFQSGLVDFWSEYDPARWAQSYDEAFLASRDLRKGVFASQAPASSWALAFNTRRPLFGQPELREAIALALDMDWLNQHLFHGAYRRLEGFFTRSDLSSYQRAANEAERALLAPFAGEVPPDMLEAGYASFAKRQDEPARVRRRAIHRLMTKAGMEIKNGLYRNVASGEALRFEILTLTREEERLALVIARQMQQAGIGARVAFVNSATYQNRVQQFDFDMMFARWSMSLSPGNEQHFYWSREAAQSRGSRNYPGIESAAVDAMIGHLLAARSREELIAAARALDRLLLGGHYVIPLFYPPGQWAAWQARVQWPQKTSLYGMAMDSLWLNP